MPNCGWQLGLRPSYLGIKKDCIVKLDVWDAAKWSHSYEIDCCVFQAFAFSGLHFSSFCLSRPAPSQAFAFLGLRLFRSALFKLLSFQTCAFSGLRFSSFRLSRLAPFQVSAFSGLRNFRSALFQASVFHALLLTSPLLLQAFFLSTTTSCCKLEALVIYKQNDELLSTLKFKCNYQPRMYMYV